MKSQVFFQAKSISLLNWIPDCRPAHLCRFGPLLLDEGLEAGEVGQGVAVRDLDDPQSRRGGGGAHDGLFQFQGCPDLVRMSGDGSNE